MAHRPAPGDVVSVRFGLVLSHYGVMTSRGTVISNSRLHDGVVEQSFHEFADGRVVRNHGPSSDLPDYVVESRARRRLGQDYRLLGSNCGHLARHAHRRKATPLQISVAISHAIRDMLR